MCQLVSVGLDPAALVPTKVSILHMCGDAVQTLLPFQHDVNRALFNAQPVTGFMGEGARERRTKEKEVFTDCRGNRASGFTGDYLSRSLHECELVLSAAVAIFHP